MFQTTNQVQVLGQVATSFDVKIPQWPKMPKVLCTKICWHCRFLLLKNDWTEQERFNQTKQSFKSKRTCHTMNGLKDPVLPAWLRVEKRCPNKPLSILGTHLTKLILLPFECLYTLEFCCANTPILAGLPWFISTRVIVLYGPLLAAEPPFLLVVSCCIPSSPSIGHTRSCTCSTRMFVW